MITALVLYHTIIYYPTLLTREGMDGTCLTSLIEVQLCLERMALCMVDSVIITTLYHSSLPEESK